MGVRSKPFRFTESLRVRVDGVACFQILKRFSKFWQPGSYFLSIEPIFDEPIPVSEL
jgi:hypothetical protein